MIHRAQKTGFLAVLGSTEKQSPGGVLEDVDNGQRVGEASAALACKHEIRVHNKVMVNPHWHVRWHPPVWWGRDRWQCAVCRDGYVCIWYKIGRCDPIWAL